MRLRCLRVWSILATFHAEESGQDLVEYAMVAAVIALGSLAAMGSVAAAINKVFVSLARKISSPPAS